MAEKEPKEATEAKKQGWWKRKSTGEKTSFIFAIVIVLLSIAIFLLWVYARPLFGDEFANRVLGAKSHTYDDAGNVISTTYYANGWEVMSQHFSDSAFKIGISFFVIGAALMLFYLIKFIINLSSMKAGRRGKTVASLLKSCFRYAIILIAIGVVLAVWGVNVTAIVAGVGVLTLVIGLGCQSLINDVVSGLFLIFDDFFSVGDIVIVDGFRGTVVSIGLKSTRFLDGGGNYKSINNSAISTVVNLSRKPSLFTVTMDASYNEDVHRVEAIIMKNLPTINAANPKLTSPLTYNGISNFDDGGIAFLFAGYCREEDRFQVTRDINRDIYQMFVDNNILVPYNQITVNPADPTNRPKASKEETEEVNASWKSRRALPNDDSDKKRTFIEKAKDAIAKEAKKAEDEDDN